MLLAFTSFKEMFRESRGCLRSVSETWKSQQHIAAITFMFSLNGQDTEKTRTCVKNVISHLKST